MDAGLKRVLVFDLGGGTLDISVLEINDGVIRVLATRGDSNLGGRDIDERIMQFCLEEYKSRFNTEVKTDRMKSLLRKKCVEAKHQLTASLNTVIEEDSMSDEQDHSLNFSRAQFEALCEPIFKKCMPPLLQVIKDSKLSKEQIDEIVLVGGSTRIPKV